MKLYILFFICFTYFIPSERAIYNEASSRIHINSGAGYTLYYQIDYTFNTPEIIFIRERFNNNNEKYAEECIKPNICTIYNTETKANKYIMGERASSTYAQMMTAYNSYQQIHFPTPKSKKRRCN